MTDEELDAWKNTDLVDTARYDDAFFDGLAADIQGDETDNELDGTPDFLAAAPNALVVRLPLLCGDSRGRGDAGLPVKSVKPSDSGSLRVVLNAEPS